MRKLLVILLFMLLAVPAHAIEAEDIDFGGFVRLRGYSMENMWSFNDDADFDNWSVFRLMTSLHAGMALSDDVGVFVQIANQNYSEGVTYNSAVVDRWEEDNNSNKIFVDNAYIDVNRFFGMPVNLRLGRQNLMYGTGFVLFDGQSQYASTSVYFDGVKLTWDITEKAKLDLLYFKDQEFNRSDGADDDITLSGAYFTGKCPVVGGQQELYVLNRKDEGFGKDIWMYGLRLSDKFSIGLDYSAEIAYQDGKMDEDTGLDQDALGYKLEAGWTFADIGIKPRLFAGYTFLSGDNDLLDGESHAWDVFYGGWPQFGDLLAWVFVNGPAGAANSATGFSSTASVIGEAAYTNLILPKVGISCFIGPVAAEVSYTKLTIDEPIGGVDDDFGDYYQIQAKYAYNKNLSFAAYAAMIEPGDAFAAPGDDTVYETFWETRVNF